MRPRLPRAVNAALSTRSERFVIRRDFGKKDIGLPHAPHAAGRIPRVIRAKKERPLASLRSRSLDCSRRRPRAH
jgi:hypothetical protein